jgi:hypothetical protein
VTSRTLDVPDVDRMAAFWSQVLAYDPEGSEFCILHSP